MGSGLQTANLYKCGFLSDGGKFAVWRPDPIVIACSGAGGHLFAGLSIAEILKKKFPDVELFFLSSDYQRAHRLVKSAGFKFHRVYSKGLLSKNLWGVIQFLIGQVVCLVQSGWLLAFIRPGLVIGTGGFASVGLILWSWVFGIPTVLHEQNLIPGKANRLLAPFVDEILVSFEESRQYFKRYRCTVTGMPVRFKSKLNKPDIRITLGLVPDRFTILVMGGSCGAHKINQLIVDTMEELTDYKERVQFIHLTGAQDYEFVKEAYMQCGFKAYIEGFSTRMETIYSSADLVISRSGSGSISEITFFGLPAILIPYPYSRDKHQLRNAQILAEKNAAVVITEDKVSSSSDRLGKVLVELINQPERLDNMAGHSRSFARPDAADRVVEEVGRLIGV